MKKTMFIDEGKWFKGNTHVHTTRSDGKKTPEEAVAIYREKGYDFFVMTDHRIYFDSKRFDKEDFLVLAGIEHNTDCKVDRFRTHHITALKRYEAKEAYEDNKKIDGSPWDGDLGYGITNEVISNANKFDNFTILAHPKWSCSFPEELLGLKDFNAIEVWNQECEYVSTTGNGEFFYDYLLKKGRKVLAIASDDIHSYRDGAIGGYIVVKAKDFTKESISKSIVNGSFYASTGPEIKDFYVEDNKVHIKTSKCKCINILFDYRGKAFYDEKNNGIEEVIYNLDGWEKYVRCELVGYDGTKAWSNPIYLD